MKSIFLSILFATVYANVDVYVSNVSYENSYVEVSIVTDEPIVGFQFKIMASDDLNAQFSVENIDLSSYNISEYQITGYSAEGYMSETASSMNNFSLFGDQEGIVIGFAFSDQNPSYISPSIYPQVLIRVPWSYEIGQVGSVSIGDAKFIKPGVESNGFAPQYIQTTITEAYPLSINGDFFDISSFELKKAYPNPFNPVTQIDYYLPVDMNVELTIYAIDGRHVKTLVNSINKRGNHSVSWDGTDLIGNSVSTGIYIYQFISGNKIYSEKITLVK